MIFLIVCTSIKMLVFIFKSTQKVTLMCDDHSQFVMVVHKMLFIPIVEKREVMPLNR